MSAAPSRADLINVDFEGDLGWTGTDSFFGQSATNGAAPNDATFFDFVDTNVITESGVWIEDSSRAYDDRMFWLRPYNDPDTICVGAYTTMAVEGSQIDFTFNFAAFDLTQPGGDAATFTKPAVEIMSWDAAAGEWLVETARISFSDGQITDPSLGIQAEYAVSDWDNLEWYSARTRFKVPELHGRPLYLWASMTNDSHGMLLDNLRASSAPEPSVFGFLLVSVCGTSFRRRRRPVSVV